MEEIKTIQKVFAHTNEVIKRMTDTYQFNDENKAFVILRATLRALRDRLSHGEAVHLGSQLPTLLRGFYYEAWSLSTPQSKSRTKNNFLSDVMIHLHGHSEIVLEEAVPAALKTILDMIDQGEAVQVLHELPKDIQELCPE